MAKSTSVVVPPNRAARVTCSGGAVSMPGKPNGCGDMGMGLME